jgi:hypothetical protein
MKPNPEQFPLARKTSDENEHFEYLKLLIQRQIMIPAVL